MLVIISDLHLTDGTSGSTISPGAFALLSERLADLSLNASQRRDGTYRPIEHVDLVLLGDTLDVIRSTQWLRSTIRPWDDVKSPALFETRHCREATGASADPLHGRQPRLVLSSPR